MTLFTAILPVFLLLIFGAFLQRWRFPFDGFLARCGQAGVLVFVSGPVVFEDQCH